MLQQAKEWGVEVNLEEFDVSESEEHQGVIDTDKESDEDVGIYDIRDDLEIILSEGPRLGYHVFNYSRRYDEFKQTRYHLDLFKHRLTFKCSKDDSRNIINKATAFDLGEIAFLYTDMQTTFTMRPFLHEGLQWDGWETDDYGHAVRIDFNGGA